MAYVKPEDVVSPKDCWTLEAVIDPGEEGKTALAVGLWGGKKKRLWLQGRVLVMRWNGYSEPVGAETRKGNPQSRGYPTWFVIEDKYREAIIETLSPDKLAIARRYFPKP